MEILIIMLIPLVIILFLVSYILGIIANKRETKGRRDFVKNNIEDYTYQPSGIEDWIDVINKSKVPYSNRAFTLFVEGLNKSDKVKSILKRYPGIDKTKIINLIFNDLYFIDMTPSLLVEVKGQPTKIEQEVLKTKTKLIYIYGYKSSGDVFVFEKGSLVSFKDR